MNIKRIKFNVLKENLFFNDVNILLGARQVGKSTLMANLKKEAERLGLKTLSFNLEFPEDLRWFSRDDEALFHNLSELDNRVIFIDEFHYLKNASKLFKSIYDLKKNIKIIASGSSSLEIHKHLKESLAGRRKIFKITPLTFEEWSQAQSGLGEFLTYGALPGLLHLKNKNEKIEYLSQMIQAYLLKDIKGLIKEENIRAFNHLLYYLAENQGNILPISHLANEIAVSAKTVESYLEILEQTYVVYGLSSFSSKLSNELKKSKKFYFYDLGIRNSLVKDFSLLENREDKGLIYESFIFQGLKFMQESNVELRFWRTKTGDEVDFIWIEDRVPIPIEVKSRSHNDRIPLGIQKFLKHYEKSKWAYVFSTDRSEDVKFEDKTIRYRKFEELSSCFNSEDRG